MTTLYRILSRDQADNSFHDWRWADAWCPDPTTLDDARQRLAAGLREWLTWSIDQHCPPGLTYYSTNHSRITAEVAIARAGVLAVGEEIRFSHMAYKIEEASK